MTPGLWFTLTLATFLLTNLFGCQETPDDANVRGGGMTQTSVSPEMALVSAQCQGSHDVIEAYQEPGPHLIVKDATDEDIKAFHSSLSAIPQDMQQLLYLSGVRVEINGSMDIHSFCVDGLYDSELSLVANRQSKVTSCLYENDKDPGLVLLMEADKEVIATATVRSVGIIISQYISGIEMAEDGSISVVKNDMFRAVLRSLAVEFLNDVDKSNAFDMNRYKDLIDEKLLTKKTPRTICDVPDDSQHEVFANYLFSDFLHNQYCGSSGRTEENDFKASRDFFKKDVMDAVSSMIGNEQDVEYSYVSCENEEATLSLRSSRKGGLLERLRPLGNSLGERWTGIFGGGKDIFGQFFASFRNRKDNTKKPSVSPKKTSSQPTVRTPSRDSMLSARRSDRRSNDGDRDDYYDNRPVNQKPSSSTGVSEKNQPQLENRSADVALGSNKDIHSKSGRKLSDNVKKETTKTPSSGALGKPANPKFDEFVKKYDGIPN
jgi:hypothetical protein